VLRTSTKATTEGGLTWTRSTRIPVSGWPDDPTRPDPADLAKVLAKRPLRDATGQVDIVVDGFQGIQLEWSVPVDIDFSTCDEGYFESWTAAADS
jgi:hypothetical protein